MAKSASKRFSIKFSTEQYNQVSECSMVWEIVEISRGWQCSIVPTWFRLMKRFSMGRISIWRNKWIMNITGKFEWEFFSVRLPFAFGCPRNWLCPPLFWKKLLSTGASVVAWQYHWRVPHLMCIAKLKLKAPSPPCLWTWELGGCEQDQPFIGFIRLARGINENITRQVRLAYYLYCSMTKN